MPTRRTRRQEAGFAMLVVFLLAAFVAISLYMELPRVVFESQRNREQTLIDRGEQYQRAIQLYYRAFQRYPPNLDALDNTNDRRFLRHRYKDPMTDKDEWRLIHAVGPGVFPDSLVNKPPGQKGQPDSETAAAASGEAAAPMWMQRRPSDVTLPSAANQADAMEPSMDNALVPGTAQVEPPPGEQGVAPAGQQQPAGFPPLAPGQIYPVQMGGVPGQQPGVPAGLTIQPAFPGGPPGQGTPAQPVTSATQQFPMQGQAAAGSNPALDIIRTMLTTPNPRGLSGVPTASGSQPGGTPMLAGVASELDADSIKVYNDRTKYNEWEFLYDPRQDRTAVAAAQPVGQTPVGVVPAGVAPGGQIPGPQPIGPRGPGQGGPFGPPGGFPPMRPGRMPFPPVPTVPGQTQ